MYFLNNLKLFGSIIQKLFRLKVCIAIFKVKIHLKNSFLTFEPLDKFQCFIDILRSFLKTFRISLSSYKKYIKIDLFSKTNLFKNKKFEDRKNK